jgi:signal-transduction protein with cAMP-binding, CBS, and nucleotidyltransferase domain
MTLADRVTFLQERTPLNVLQTDCLRSLARQIEVVSFPPQQHSSRSRDQPPAGLYILVLGKLETLETGPGGVSYLPGAVINLEALLLDQPVEQSIQPSPTAPSGSSPRSTFSRCWLPIPISSKPLPGSW